MVSPPVPWKPLPISPIFHPKIIVDGNRPDIVFLTSDQLLFYAHRHYLKPISQNAFGGLLNAKHAPRNGLTLLPVAQSHKSFDLALRVIYNIPYANERYELETLLKVLQILKTYGFPLDQYTSPPSPFYSALIAEAPSNPLEVFVVAAENKLDALAAVSSSFLLSLDISSISDAMAIRMGPIYLRNLVGLHDHRLSVLRGLLCDPPKPHSDPSASSITGHKELQVAWYMAVAGFVGDLRPGEHREASQLRFRRLTLRAMSDFPVDVLQAGLLSGEQDLGCNECKEQFHAKITSVVSRWKETAVSYTPSQAL